MATFNSSLPLFLKGAEPKAATPNSINLYIEGSSAGYKYTKNSLNLFLLGEAGGSSLNLFIQGISEPGSIGGSLNLVLGGHGDPAENSLNLFTVGSATQYLPALNTLTPE